MRRQHTAFFHQTGLLALFAVLCFALVASCPVKRLIFDLPSTGSGGAHQPVHMIHAGHVTPCATNNTVAHVSRLDLRQHGFNTLAGLLFLAIPCLRWNPAVPLFSLLFYRYRNRPAPGIPLFLKNSMLLL